MWIYSNMAKSKTRLLKLYAIYFILLAFLHLSRKRKKRAVGELHGAQLCMHYTEKTKERLSRARCVSLQGKNTQSAKKQQYPAASKRQTAGR